MNQEVKKLEIIKELAVMAEHYEKKLSLPLLDSYLREISEFEIDDIKAFCKEYMRQNSSRFFPSIGDFVNALDPSSLVFEQDEAREIAAKITAAVIEYGYNNPHWARPYIGEYGWRAIELNGGWAYFCNNLDKRQIPVVQAQLRELVISVMHKQNQAHFVDKKHKAVDMAKKQGLKKPDLSSITKES